MITNMSEASRVETIFKLSSITLQDCPVYEEDLRSLAEKGFAHGIALLSGYSVTNKTTVKDTYPNGVGKGIRTYTVHTEVEIPTLVEKNFLLTFDTRTSLYFRDREARTSYKNWLFNGISFPFERLLGEEASVWELFYSVGSPMHMLEFRISKENEEGIRHARKRWLELFR